MFRPCVLIWVASIHFDILHKGLHKKKETANKKIQQRQRLPIFSYKWAASQKKRVESDPFGLVRSHPDHVFLLMGAMKATSTATGGGLRNYGPQIPPQATKTFGNDSIFKGQTEESDDFEKTPFWGNYFQQRVRHDEDRNFP